MKVAEGATLFELLSYAASRCPLNRYLPRAAYLETDLRGATEGERNRVCCRVPILCAIGPVALKRGRFSAISGRSVVFS